MTLAFLGHGRVGGTLADHFQRHGHRVVLATDDAESATVAAAREKNPGLEVASTAEAVAAAEVVFLATPFKAVAEVLGGIADQLAGKVLVDCTNPVGPGVSHLLHGVEAGSDQVQRLAPGARVVKAFSIYGFENLVDNRYPGSLLPAMLYCGDDAAAKQTVSGLIAQLGWTPVDVGSLGQALHLEHLTLLWVRMARAEGGSPNLVWAALRR